MGQRPAAETAQRRGSSARRPRSGRASWRTLRTRGRPWPRSSPRRHCCSPSPDRAGRHGPRSAARRARNAAPRSAAAPGRARGRTARRPLRPRSLPGHGLRLRRQGEAGLVDQTVEQIGPPREHVGERRCMGEDQREMPRKLRPRLQQAVEIDAARQPLDDVGQTIERALRDRDPTRSREGARAASPRTPFAPPGERKRSGLAGAPIGNPLQRDGRIGETERCQFVARECRGRWTGAPRGPARAS